MARKYGITCALMLTTFALGLSIGQLPKLTAQTSDRVVEVRTYTAGEGKLDALAKRMGTDERKFFEKYGMKSVLYSVAADPPLSQNTFVYILSHQSREAAKKSWASVLQDPAFKSLIERTGRLSTKAEVMFLKPTDYSPVQ
jgi:hypothetical protein